MTDPCVVSAAFTAATSSKNVIRMLPDTYSMQYFLNDAKTITIVATGAMSTTDPMNAIWYTAPGANLTIRGYAGTFGIECQGSLSGGLPVLSSLNIRDSNFTTTNMSMFQYCSMTIQNTDLGSNKNLQAEYLTLDHVRAVGAGSATVKAMTLNITTSLISNMPVSGGSGHVDFSTFYDAPLDCGSAAMMTYTNNISYAPDVAAGGVTNLRHPLKSARTQRGKFRAAERCGRTIS
jgi:hypothetical protein